MLASRSELGEDEPDDDEEDGRRRCDNAVRPEDGSADQALESVAGRCLCDLQEDECEPDEETEHTWYIPARE